MNLETLQDGITDSLNAGHSVVLLVGPPGCGKSRFLRELHQVGILDVGKELARELMAIPRKEWGEKSLQVMKSLLETFTHPVIALDNIEILLSPELNLDLWPALEKWSGTKQLVVAWTGRVDDQEIQWGDPGVPGHVIMNLENCPAKILSLTG